MKHVLTIWWSVDGNGPFPAARLLSGYSCCCSCLAPSTALSMANRLCQNECTKRHVVKWVHRVRYGSGQRSIGRLHPASLWTALYSSLFVKCIIEQARKQINKRKYRTNLTPNIQQLLDRSSLVIRRISIHWPRGPLCIEFQCLNHRSRCGKVDLFYCGTYSSAGGTLDAVRRTDLYVSSTCSSPIFMTMLKTRFKPAHIGSMWWPPTSM